MEQYKAIMMSGFGWADFWKSNLEATGDYVVQEIVINGEAIQKRWASENKVRYSHKQWALDIVEAQIAEFKPDVFWTDEINLMSPQFFSRIKKNHPCVKLIMAWDGVAFNNIKKFNGVDIMLSCVSHIVEYYQQHGIESFLLPFAFDKSILEKIIPANRPWDVSFVGGLSLGKGAHDQRFRLLKELANNIDINLQLSCNFARQAIKSTYELVKHPKINGLFDRTNDILNLYSLLRHNKGSVFGIEMYQVFADSKITINSHIDAALNKAGNMRLFEATGVGTCLVTDWKDNLSDYFEPEKEVVTYRYPEECVEKVLWLLDHPIEREMIATAGQKRCLNDHSYKNRSMQLDKIIKSKI
jgi:spore maturation protein CgeB